MKHADTSDMDTSTLCHASAAGEVAWLAWRRFSARLERDLDVPLRPHGLNQGLLAVLLAIGADQGPTQQDLADRLDSTRANISQLVSKLERMGLVQRQPAGRSYALWLTESAQNVLINVVPEQRRIIAAAFSAIAPDQQQALQNVMLQLAPDVS